MSAMINFENKFAMIKTALIDEPAFKMRRALDIYDLGLLADSIKQIGIIEPLTVCRAKNSRYRLICGERRLTAAKQAGIKKVPCMIVKSDELMNIVFAISDNMHRCNLDLFETADLIYKASKQGDLSIDEIAEMLGVSGSSVEEKLNLLNLDPTLRDRMISVGLTDRHIKAIAKLPHEKQGSALNYVIAKSLTPVQTEDCVRKIINGSFDPSKSVTSKRQSTVLDSRMFANSLTRLVKILTDSGINVRQDKRETDEYTEYKIRIPKQPAESSAEKCLQLKIC